MGGKRSSGEGSVIYDKRRKKPYRARVTIGWEFNDETGKSKQVFKDLGSYKTKGEATAALSEFLRNPFDLDNKNITFSQLYEKWFEDFFADGEHDSQRYRIRAAYKYCSSIYNKKVREITILDMKNCIYKGKAIAVRGKYKGEEQSTSPSTKENIKYLFNHLFSYAVDARIVDRNYAKDFSLDKKFIKKKS